jgi:hypothetical protein
MSTQRCYLLRARLARMSVAAAAAAAAENAPADGMSRAEVAASLGLRQCVSLYRAPCWCVVMSHEYVLCVERAGGAPHSHSHTHTDPHPHHRTHVSDFYIKNLEPIYIERLVGLESLEI